MKFWATPVNLPEVLIISICGIGLFWSFYLGSPSETLIGIFGGYLGAKGNGSSSSKTTSTTTTNTTTQSANSRDRPEMNEISTATSEVINSNKTPSEQQGKKSIIDN